MQLSSNKETLWRNWLAGLFCLCQFMVTAPSALSAERNIILFVTDDLSPDTGCYGNTAIRTPSIDALARDATLFTSAFATTASCSASRSVILSGLHNHCNGQYGHLHNYHKFGTHKWVQSLPTLLKDQGYRTVRIGKFHVGPDEVYPFDEHFEADARNPVLMAERCRSLFAKQSESPFFLLFATDDPHRGGGLASDLAHRPDRFGNSRPGMSHAEVDQVAYKPDEVVVPSFLPDTPACRAELAQYYQSVSRVDQGVGRLMKILKETGCWDNTLLVFTSDHGMAFAGAKTTVYEAGLHVPMIVRNPYESQAVQRSNALVSLLDITPTLLDFAGGLDRSTGGIQDNDKKLWQWHTYAEGEGTAEGVGTGEMRFRPYRFHGKSFLSVLGQSDPTGWDQITASHTFHEIQMYYPMRVVRDRKYKLIWNIAHRLPFPFASDLWKSPTWQTQHLQGPQASYGSRTVDSYTHRPEFELYDIEQDPHETENLSGKKEFASVLAEYQQKIKDFQLETGDGWALKWKYD